jgi:hypothetical protein
MVFLNTTKQLERLPSNRCGLSTFKSSSSCADNALCFLVQWTWVLIAKELGIY